MQVGASRYGFLLAVLAVVAVAPADRAPATITDPLLAITDVELHVGLANRVVRLEGEFPSGGLAQQNFALHVLIHVPSGGAFVRYALAGGAHEGGSTDQDFFLVNGLQLEEVPELLATGTPSADARVLFSDAARIDLLLPASIPAGGAEAVLILVEPQGNALSNPARFVSQELPQ